MPTSELIYQFNELIAATSPNFSRIIRSYELNVCDVSFLCGINLVQCVLTELVHCVVLVFDICIVFSVQMVAYVYIPSRNIGERNGTIDTLQNRLQMKFKLLFDDVVLLACIRFGIRTDCSSAWWWNGCDDDSGLVFNRNISVDFCNIQFSLYARGIAAPSAGSRHRLLESRIENHLISSIYISRFIPDSRLLLLLFLSCRLSLRQPDCVVYAYTVRPQNVPIVVPTIHLCSFSLFSFLSVHSKFYV